MNKKFFFVFEFLLASAWTENLSEENVLEHESFLNVENVVAVSKENKINLSDFLCRDEKEINEVNENVENIEKDDAESA